MVQDLIIWAALSEHACTLMFLAVFFGPAGGYTL